MSRRLNQSLAKLLRTPARKRGFAAAELLIRWPEVCPQIADCCTPAKLSGRVLTLHTASSSVSQQVSGHAPQLVAQINAFFGQELITGIKPMATYTTPVRPQRMAPPVGPSAQATTWASSKTQNVRDAGLQQRLAQLGAVIRQHTLDKTQNT